MEKISKNILIAASVYVLVLIFDALCTFVPSIGQPIQEWAGVAISFVADIIFAWIFIDLLRHEAQKSITKDASIMGLVSVGIFVLDLIANVLIYLLIYKPSPTEDIMEKYYYFSGLRHSILYVPGTLMTIVSMLRLSMAHGRNLLVSIGGWLYGITFSLYLVFYIFGLVNVVFPSYDRYMFWYTDMPIYITLAGNVGSALFFFGLSMKDVQGRKTQAAHTPAVSYILYYASFVALSFGADFLVKDLLEKKVSWMVDFHTGLFSALALVALAAALILIGLTIGRSYWANNVLKKFPATTSSNSNGTHVLAYVFAGILLFIGVGLLFSDSRDEDIDKIYAFSSMALAAGLVLVGVISWMNSKIKQHLSAPSPFSFCTVFYVLGYLCMAAFLVIELVNIEDRDWDDLAWYLYGFRGTTGIAIGLALVGLGGLCQYSRNIKTLDTIIPEQKESPHEQ